MRLAKRTAVCLLVPILCSCAAGQRVSNSELFKELKKSPLRPWYARQVLSGDPARKLEYYGVQLKLDF